MRHLLAVVLVFGAIFGFSAARAQEEAVTEAPVADPAVAEEALDANVAAAEEKKPPKEDPGEKTPPPPEAVSGGTTAEPAVEWHVRQGGDDRLRSYGDDILGDGIDPHTGSITFSHTDISLPGNSNLEVALRRSRSQGFLNSDTAVVGGTVNVDFADWELLTPRIEIVLASDVYDPGLAWTGQRCSQSYFAQFPTAYVPLAGGGGFQGFSTHQYSNGLMLKIPGAGGQQILESPQGAHWPVSATHVTTENWFLSCITSIPSGGEGFTATAPNGDVYKFDIYVKREYKPIGTRTKNSTRVKRDKHLLMASEVTDVHGNWVKYDYDASGRLTRIYANDGREITLSYGNTAFPDLITSAQANGRSWTYAYRRNTFIYRYGAYPARQAEGQVLSSVTQPDGKAWSFTLDGMTAEPLPGRPCVTEAATFSLTHPYGIIGTFNIREMAHRQSPNWLAQKVFECPDPETLGGGTPPQPIFVQGPSENMGVTSKVISGPGVATATWTYAYENDDSEALPAAGDNSNWTVVTDPLGNKIIYHHFWNNSDFGGKLKKKEVFQAGVTAALEVIENSYVIEGRVGFTFASIGPVPRTVRDTARLTETKITRGNKWYKTINTYNMNFSSANYSFGLPIMVEQCSLEQGGCGVGNTNVRTVETVYQHDADDWVLGLPTEVKRNSVVFEEHGYDAKGRRLWTDAFGIRQRTYTYFMSGTAAGLVNTSKDALNRITTFNNYKRGYPQTVTRPDFVNLYGTIDNNGWITSQTDAKGVITNFQYNNMGWLTLIDRPGAWSDTVISYANVGLWNFYQRSTRGKAETLSWLDGFHRPWRVRSRAVSGGGLTTFVNMDYDIFGRETFRSFPSTAAAAADGIDTSYDALGRVTQVRENVAPFATTTTEYIDGARTKTTGPEGAITNTYARGYGAPGDLGVISIIQPTDVHTAITWDIYGNMTSVRQYGAHNGYVVDQTQAYYYDARQRLCRHSVPETGDTLFGYNAANEMTSVARGQPQATTCGGLPPGSTVYRTYDSLGRVDLVDYPSGTADIDYAYDANGNVTSNVRGGVAWTYLYDDLNQLTQEKLVIDARTYTTTYNYNNDGALLYQVTPGGRSVNYAPNGLGQAVRARVAGLDYAGAMTYHASGQVLTLNYANGQALTNVYNARQLLQSTKIQKAGAYAVWFAYGYDANGRILTISDSATAGQNRTYAYDDLGRLESATGPWGTGTFDYDSLGNIRQKTLGTRVVDIEYNIDNQVSRARDTDDGSVWRYYTHDAKGNVTDNDNLTFTYDAAEQPTAIAGAASGAFVYDGNLKRVKQVVDGVTIYSVYSLSGAILYRDNVTDSKTTDYISVAGMTVARFENSVVSYVHQDHLGSPVAATDSTGAVLWREDYTPYGEERQNPAANDNDQSFTRHIKDDATGLFYMQARYMDPVIGRFLSGDPVGFSVDAPQYFNRYSYVANDPVNATDPTGEEIGDRFDDPDAAGRDAVADVNPDSIAENREYGGRIRREVTVERDSKGNVVRNRDGSPKNKTQYYATDPVAGDHDSTRLGPSDPTSDVGDYHTHGDYSKTDGARTDKAGDQYDSERFSDSDKNSARGNAAASKEYRSTNGETYKSYLGTPSGDTKKFVPEREYQR